MKHHPEVNEDIEFKQTIKSSDQNEFKNHVVHMRQINSFEKQPCFSLAHRMHGSSVAIYRKVWNGPLLQDIDINCKDTIKDFNQEPLQIALIQSGLCPGGMANQIAIKDQSMQKGRPWQLAMEAMLEYWGRDKIKCSQT